MSLEQETPNQGPSMSLGRGTPSQGASKDMEMPSNPAYNPTLEEQSVEEDCEETSLMEPQGGFLTP